MAALVLLGVAGSLGYVSLKGRADQLQAQLVNYLQAGQKELEAGRSALTEANNKHDTALLVQANAHFDAARNQFNAAAALADNSTLLHYLEYVPAVGNVVRSRHAAVDGIAKMGAALSNVGQDFSIVDAHFVKPSSPAGSPQNLLSVLNEIAAGLPQIRADLDRARLAAAQVDANVVPTSQQAAFKKARDQLTSASSGLAELQRLMPVLGDLLGTNGPRRYLIEQVNPSELRAGGGFIGSYSLLRAENGVVRLDRSGDSYSLADPRPTFGQPGYIPMPGPYREVVPTTSWSFVDTNEFPDFPSSAQAALNFVEPRIGKIDGVISIDYYAVAAMLDLTGPLTVPGFSLSVNGSNFINTLMGLEGDTTHKLLLSALAGPLISDILTLSADHWPALMSSLSSLASGKHIQIFLKNPSAELEMDRIGWSGRINSVRAADFLMAVESNYGGGKANYVISRSYSLVLTQSGGLLHHRLTITYRNRLGNVVNDFNVYQATLRVYAGSTATFSPNAFGPNNLRRLAIPYPDPPPSGTTFIAGWLPSFAYAPNQLIEVVVDYDTPWPPTHNNGWQIYWQKQPGTDADRIDVVWSNAGGKTYYATGKLTQDEVMTLRPTGLTLGTGQAAPTLPQLSP